MTKSRDRLGVAIIGAGDMGGTHAGIWRQIEGVEVVAVADVDRARAEALAQKWGVAAWGGEISAAIDRPDVDIVSVCVPASFHAGVVLEALAHDKHVLSEKPIARTLADADRIREAAAAAARRGVKYTLSFQRRYLKLRQKQAELIQSGSLGRPVLMQSVHMMQIRPKLAMHELHVNGGPAVDFGVHQYDYWRTQFGSEAVRVMAQGAVFGRDRPELATVKVKAPDTLAIVVTFASGDIGEMTISWGLPPGIKPGGGGERILGPGGVLTHRDGQIVIAREGGRDEVIPVERNDDRVGLFGDFARCIRTDDTPWITADDGRAALEIAVAVLESVETGRAVDLQGR